MAKKRSSRPHRDNHPVARDPLAEAVYLPVPVTLVRPQPPKLLTEVQDNRRWHPEPMKPALTKVGGHARIVAKDLQRLSAQNKNVSGPNGPRKSQRSISSRLAFDVPERVLVCVRREQRRQVLFAKRAVRSGAGQKRRRSRWSDISC